MLFSSDCVQHLDDFSLCETLTDHLIPSNMSIASHKTEIMKERALSMHPNTNAHTHKPLDLKKVREIHM